MVRDDALEERIRGCLADVPGVVEKRMFGGLAFLVGGHMAAAASGAGGIMVRVEPGETEDLVREPGAERVVMRGRAMDGWIRVDDSVLAEDEALAAWVGRGLAYVQDLPAKEPKAPTAPGSATPPGRSGKARARKGPGAAG